MPRIRYLKPEFFSDEDLAELPFEARLTYAGLWCYADREGRLEDRPKFLKAMIFPYDNIDMDEQLGLLCKPKHGNGIPFLIRYMINNIKFIEIVSWHKHQKPHHTEKESIFPPAPPLSPPHIRLREDKDKDKDKVEEPSTELKNVPITVKRRLKNTSEYNCPLFNDFWNVYPKKEGKGKAWEEWLKIKPNPDELFLNKIIDTISKFKTTNQWLSDNGKYIPLPATWLHQKRWDDEVQVKPTW